MTCKRGLDDEQIAAVLQNVFSDSDSSENVSEPGNEILEDDIQSDMEDELADTQESDENTAPQPEISGNFTSRSDSRIITVPQATIKSKSRHCWATSKGQNAGRISSTNIVRMARGPTRECKSLYDPISCFNVFFTDEIISEIVQWTNAEIFITRWDDMTAATFRDTNGIEIRALIGILTLSAALKDNHLSNKCDVCQK